VLATGSAFATVPLDDGPHPQNGPLPAAACANLMPTIVGAGFIVGNNGPDVILGSNGPDTIFALGGNDVVIGLGDDDMKGADGEDWLIGGPHVQGDRGDGGADVDACPTTEVLLNCP